MYIVHVQAESKRTHSTQTHEVVHQLTHMIGIRINIKYDSFILRQSCAGKDGGIVEICGVRRLRKLSISSRITIVMHIYTK